MPFVTRVYTYASPLLLLLLGIGAIALAMCFRALCGMPFVPLNGFLLIVGIVIYFVPGFATERDPAQKLRRKLLWLFLASTVIILANEIVRGAYPIER